MKKFVLLIFTVLFIAGCNFEVPGADEKFGTQNFVSAVSIIELHKVRKGEYPKNLKSLEFLGDWDAIWLSAVKYEKTDSGYNLYVTRGWAGKPSLEFPEKFKQGLGIEKTNVQWVRSET